MEIRISKNGKNKEGKQVYQVRVKVAKKNYFNIHSGCDVRDARTIKRNLESFLFNINGTGETV